MKTSLHQLRTVLRWMELKPGTLVMAALAGAAALLSGVGLIASASWLIARASQHPNIVEVSLVVVAVRGLGIGKGVFRYQERWLSHHVALTGLANVRAECYRRLAQQPLAHITSLSRGELLHRLGADLDVVAQVVVSGLLPVITIGLVLTCCLAAVAPLSGLLLCWWALTLVLPSVMGTWWLLKRTVHAQRELVETRGAIAALTLDLMEHPAEHAITGTGQRFRQNLAHEHNKDLRLHRDLGRWQATSNAIILIGIALAVGGGFLMIGSDAANQQVSPVWAVVVTLLPLALAEVLQPLVDATGETAKALTAAQRLIALATSPHDRVVNEARRAPTAHFHWQSGPSTAVAVTEPTCDAAAQMVLQWSALTCGWGETAVCDLSAGQARAGEVIAIVGESGCGKTTALLTLAGLLTPLDGTVQVVDAHHDTPLSTTDLTEEQRARSVVYVSEDAHIFGTTIAENLRVAAGSVPDATLTAALTQVGLGDWFAAQPHGLATVLGSGGTTMSGGERRRLLLARAWLMGGTMWVLDEPNEHLDARAIADFHQQVLALARTRQTTVVMATHHLNALDPRMRVLAV